ncbi:MAG TPA: integrin alpha, partial [Anaerolineae bacterium]|nr:integrin alpha [Anaerolineae bacterium]
MLALAPQLAVDWFYDGTTKGDEMGYAVATAGDVDGDGYDDLVAGAAGATGLVSREGVVSLFPGGPGGLADTRAWQAGGGQQSARFGAALGAAGDLNGDGYGDLVVGAPEYNNGTSKAGAAMVFYGSSGGLSPTPDWSFVSPI